MAVPFYVPDAEEEQSEDRSATSIHNHHNHNHHYQQQSPASESSSAIPTPLQSPVNGEHLVQAFCEALYRYSCHDSPRWSYPPPSPSCSGGLNHSASDLNTEFVFPHFCHHPLMSPNEDSRMQSPRTPVRITRRHRIRLSSTGEEEEEDQLPPQSYHPVTNSHIDFEEHFQFMAAREGLAEFPGRVPKKKKTSKSSSTSTSSSANHSFITARNSNSSSNTKAMASKEQNLAWPAVVTAVVIAVGCGYLVTR